MYIKMKIYIICSGKSCDFIDESFFKNKITIGINQVYKKFNCKYYIRKEKNHTDIVLKNISKESKLFVTRGNCGNETDEYEKYINKNFKDNKNIIICDNTPNAGFDLHKNINKNYFYNYKENKKTNKLIATASTLCTGIHLAYYMGAKNIILVGQDCCLIDNEANFTNYHEKETLTIFWNNQDEYNEWLTKIENQTIHIKNILKNNFKINIHSLNPFINYNLEGHKQKII